MPHVSVLFAGRIDMPRRFAIQVQIGADAKQIRFEKKNILISTTGTAISDRPAALS